MNKPWRPNVGLGIQQQRLEVGISNGEAQKWREAIIWRNEWRQALKWWDNAWRGKQRFNYRVD